MLSTDNWVPHDGWCEKAHRKQRPHAVGWGQGSVCMPQWTLPILRGQQLSTPAPYEGEGS